MNRIFFADNLPILRGLPDDCVDLIYVDPPFNTRKTRKQTRLRTVHDEGGDRRGFQGRTYRTVELGTKSYSDSFDPQEYIHEFLKPRLEEAHRVLKPHGSLYFHVDYREVHYCKILLDEIFGRDSFLNEIIWAYDYGGRPKSKWPAKHDNILFYVKDPGNYIFNSGAIDREPYMAPGLVGSEKASAGKLPTDVWWPGYVAAHIANESSAWILRGQNALWWQTIVPTNSRERVGYPTQKPRKLLDRIIKASSVPGALVLDFFAGSGTTGDSCLALGRAFILVDNNRSALEVMAQRFGSVDDIEWVNFDPEPHRRRPQRTVEAEEADGLPELEPDFVALAAAASSARAGNEAAPAGWENSPFEWLLSLPAREKNRLGRHLIQQWCRRKGLAVESRQDSGTSLRIGQHTAEIRLSTISQSNSYEFGRIRSEDYDHLVCLGLSPLEAHCWVIRKDGVDRFILGPISKQNSKLKVNPHAPPPWLGQYGGRLDRAIKLLAALVEF